MEGSFKAVSSSNEIVIEGSAEEGLVLVFNGKIHALPAGIFPKLKGTGRLVLVPGSLNATGFRNIATSQVNSETFVNGVDIFNLIERITGETIERPKQRMSASFVAGSVSSSHSGEDVAGKVAEKIRLKKKKFK